jgi:hypothetical protein
MNRATLLLAALAVSACSSDVAVGKIEAEVSVTPTFTDLGIHPVGTELDTTITVAATEAQVKVLTVDVFNGEGEAFSLETEALPTIPADSIGELVIQWLPEEPGQSWTEITIVHSAGQHTVELRGEAGQPAARVLPALVDFGRVPAGTTATETITIENQGDLELDLDGASFDSGLFSTADALPASIAPGDSYALTVSFSPTDDEAAAGTATLDLGDWLDPGAVDLRGNDCDAGGGGSFDADGDGFSWCASDCDDESSDVNPGAAEVCDGVDNNCDGVVDEGTSCFDDDGDGVTEDEGDCNDADSSVGPGATEDYANGIDDDCDGVVDYGETDDDGDGYIVAAGDCNEGNPDIYPGAPETANGLDDDCDGIIDEGTTAYDDDGDGYTEVAGDCDDGDAGVYPGAAETADWVDEDCDGTVDEGTSAYDDDGDGFTENGGDCDDGNAAVSPAAIEIADNGVDDDCDTSTPD